MNITLIGAGNLGHHLGLALFNAGHIVDVVYSRTLEKAQRLAIKINAKATNNLKGIESSSELIIVAVKDDDIHSVAEHLSYLKDIPIVHTSGSISSTVLSKFKHFGVFYPLQTFSLSKPISFDKIPICVHGNSRLLLERLEALGQSISNNVQQVDDKARGVIHLSAVLVNNFTNYLFTLAEDLCLAEGLDFKILKPLINETIAKLDLHSPSNVQTGPAVRNDQKTILKHLTLLDDHPKEKDLYAQITSLIFNRFKN